MFSHNRTINCPYYVVFYFRGVFLYKKSQKVFASSIYFCIKKWVKEIIIFVLIWSAFPADWSCIEVLVICAMYRNRGNLKKQMFYMMLWVSLYAIVSFFCVNKVYGLIQPFVILVYPLLKMYNGERGKLNTKWLFYIYYPLHLFIIGIFRILIYGNISLLF